LLNRLRAEIGIIDFLPVDLSEHSSTVALALQVLTRKWARLRVVLLRICNEADTRI
jgi:hypothetical protein